MRAPLIAADPCRVLKGGMIDDVLLRPVTDADGPALARLIAGCFAEYEGCLYEPAEFPELAAPARWAAGRGTRLIVAEATGIVSGCVAATPIPESGAVELHKVYLASRLRGTGLGARLLETGFDLARAIRADRLVLWSDTRFSRAHRFYEKLGFGRVPVTRYLADVSASWEYRYERAL